MLQYKDKYEKCLKALRSFSLLVAVIGGFVLYFAIELLQWVLGGVAMLLFLLGGTGMMKVNKKQKELDNDK